MRVRKKRDGTLLLVCISRTCLPSGRRGQEFSCLHPWSTPYMLNCEQSCLTLRKVEDCLPGSLLVCCGFSCEDHRCCSSSYSLKADADRSLWNGAVEDEADELPGPFSAPAVCPSDVHFPRMCFVTSHSFLHFFAWVHSLSYF